MKLGIPQNLKTEMHPFRQISVTSFIKGGLSIILAVIILLTIKSDFKEGKSILAAEKIFIALGLLTLGGRSIWRGYQNEYDFNLTEIYDPAHGTKVNYLLGQRSNNAQTIANQYANIMHSKTFSLAPAEKGTVKNWQFVFYKLASKKGVSKLFDYLPYPITNFIANQSSPVALISFFMVVLATFSFVAYLEIIPVSMLWVNLFILIGLLSWWRPTRIDSVLERDIKSNLSNRVLFFVVFYVITVFLYKPYASEVNISLMISILIVAGIMIYTALLSFKLIESIFAKREMVNVDVSNIDLVTHRAATQPNNILQQFDNVLQQQTGWSFKSLTKDARGLLAGDQNRKGDFEFEYIYETHPRIVSTTYDEQNERQLSKIWKIGTALLCVGLILFFIGILRIPGIDSNLVRNNPEMALSTYSPQILTSLYFILFGIAFYFFGNKLVYEVYMFFNTEIFFESNLVLFRAYGNYDEFEHITGNIKRKDTSTDFTPDIKVCKLTSSIFVHPYMNKGDISKKPRFLLSVNRDEVLLQNIINGFKQNMTPYMMTFASNDLSNQNIQYTETKKIE